MTKPLFQKVAITGGGGYVGSALVPALLEAGYEVEVLDLFWYGQGVFAAAANHPRLVLLKLDIRDEAALGEALRGVDAVIHLACISNDPSFELDARLGKSVNYDAFFGLVRVAAAHGVKRFIYASSSSVYGVKSEPNVTEEASCEPLTDYSKYKYLCEEVLRKEGVGRGQWVILRPATVCGYAPRLRLDLTVNVLTIHALAKKMITVFGGTQLRPNLHIHDMVAAYQLFLTAPGDLIHGQTFNVGYQNRTVAEIAEIVRRQVGDQKVQVTVEPTSDLRSYHINSERLGKVLGFVPKRTIEHAVQSICDAYDSGRIPEALSDPRYYNIKTMQALKQQEIFVG